MPVVDDREPSSDRLSWTKGLAPRYIALFLLVVYLDQLAPRTLPLAGLLPAIVGLVLAGVVCHFWLFRPVAARGLLGRARLEDLGMQTLGERGCNWVLRPLMGLVHVVWFAVTIHYAIEYSLTGLISLGLVDPVVSRPQFWLGRALPGGVFLFTAGAWSITSSLLGLVTFRLVAAVMAGYQPFVALALGGMAAFGLVSAGRYEPLGFDAVTAEPPEWPAAVGVVRMLELVVGFFATHAALGADWGRASRNQTDVNLGGLVGIAAASVVTGTIVLLIVAGALGRNPVDPSLAAATEAQRGYRLGLSQELPEGPLMGRRMQVSHHGGVNYALHRVIAGIEPRWLAGALSLLLGAGLLGPACFAPLLIARFWGSGREGARRWPWALAGAVATWPLILWGVPVRLDLVFSALGVVMAPLVGVLASDQRHSSRTSAGFRFDGLAAWLLGSAVAGLLALTNGATELLAPSLVGFVVAWAGFRVFSNPSRGSEPSPTLPDASGVSSARTVG